jgi:hypothetical protein
VPTAGIPTEQPSPAARPGWHGITARQEKRFLPEDWKLWGVLGGEATLVDVVDHSPAWRAGIRSGAWIGKIDGGTFDAFQAKGAPIGTKVIVKWTHPTRGPILAEMTLSEPPKPKQVLPELAFECGPTLKKEDRPKWLTALAESTASHAEVRLGVFLCQRCIGDDGCTVLERTAKLRPWKLGELCKRLRMSRATAFRALQGLNRLGFVDITSGQKSRRVNIYRCCWPRPPAQNVILFPPVGQQ